MQVELSIGEIVDKLSILQIKQNSIKDKSKLINIENEYLYLHKIVFDQLNVNMEDYTSLFSINQILWDIEDSIRVKEKKQEFDKEFIELARSVYITNDKRAELKKEINIKYSSKFVEEKSYEKY